MSCTTDNSAPSPEEDAIANGTIAYPFVDETRRLGKDGPQDKFIIRSTVGDKEYSIEIPGAARDYDVQVPLAEIGEADTDVIAGRKPKQLGSPLSTDREMIGALPRLDRDRPGDTALLDSAFGVGNTQGPKQSPSYTLGIAKVNDLYKRRQYEYALVEVNTLLAYYPNSPQLNKMKGTVLVKMHNLPLAELAWIKVLELDPQDRVVRAALDKLQKRLAAQGKVAAANTAGPPQPIPKPVGTAPPPPEDALAH